MSQTRSHALLLVLVAAVPLAAILTLAIASHGRGLLIGRKGPAQSCYARIEYGHIAIHFQRTDAGEAPQWLASSWPHDWTWSSPQETVWQSKFAFGYAVGGSAGGNAVRKFTFPVWPLAIVALVPLVALLAWRDKSRR